MKLVVDASVALKWFLAGRPQEQYVDVAIEVGELIQTRGAHLYAPPHWVLEVVAVVAREEPLLVDTTIAQLSELNPILVSSTDLLARAAAISVNLDHHLFDTLYHAVALEVGATLVTADERYHAKAKSLGAITMLASFRP